MSLKFEIISIQARRGLIFRGGGGAYNQMYFLVYREIGLYM